MTDSTSYECPVEGCDYGEEEDKTLAQVRGHVNSNGDEDHVWQNVKHELLAEAEKREATQAKDDEDDDNETGDEQGDPGEVPGPDGETGHLGDVEEGDGQSDADDEESTDMATQEEYEEQYSDEDGDLPGGDEGEEQPEDGGEGGGDDQDGGGFSVPSVSASTVVLVVGVAVAGLLIWKLYSGGDAASDYEAPEEQADTDDVDDGGMAAVEAGTGGVEV